MGGADVGDEDELPLYVLPEPHPVPAGSADPVAPPGVASDGWARRPPGFSTYAWIMPSRLITTLTFLLTGLVGLLVSGRHTTTEPEPSRWLGVALAVGIVLLLLTIAVAGVVAAPTLPALSALMLTAAILSAATQVLPLAILERRRRGRLLRSYRRRSWWRVDVLEAMTYPGHVIFESPGAEVTGSTPPGSPPEPLARVAQMSIARQDGDLRRAAEIGAAGYSPSDPVLTYNIACLAIVDGQLEPGLQWLEPQFAAIRSQVAGNATALGLTVRRR